MLTTSSHYILEEEEEGEEECSLPPPTTYWKKKKKKKKKEKKKKNAHPLPPLPSPFPMITTTTQLLLPQEWYFLKSVCRAHTHMFLLPSTPTGSGCPIQFKHLFR
jgi:hypothetical protein